jgi:hypothetical protein
MDIEDLEKQLDELKLIDPNISSPEQLTQIVDKLSSIMDSNESFLLKIKSELDQLKLETNE